MSFNRSSASKQFRSITRNTLPFFIILCKEGKRDKEEKEMKVKIDKEKKEAQGKKHDEEEEEEKEEGRWWWRQS